MISSNLSKTVFVHIDAGGTYLGNGGFLMLTNLANELAAMGYETFVFDQKDRLKWENFSWLCFSDYKFEIASVDSVFGQHANDYVIVTSWLNVLLPRLRRLLGIVTPELPGIPRRTLGITIPNMRIVPHLRYWCQDELLRHTYPDTRRFCLKYLDKIAINNSSLALYYRSLGFSNIIYLENWIQSDLFTFEDEDILRKIPTSIGHQSDRDYQVYSILKSCFGEDKVLLCEGDHYEVSEKMKMSDFYVFFNRPSPAIRVFKGETFGASLFEAMACGCVCVAVKHEGNKFLRGTIPLVQNMSEAVECIKTLMDNPLKKEKIREESLELIQNKFRFNKDRKKSIAELLA